MNLHSFQGEKPPSSDGYAAEAVWEGEPPTSPSPSSTTITSTNNGSNNSLNESSGRIGPLALSKTFGKRDLSPSQSLKKSRKRFY